MRKIEEKFFKVLMILSTVLIVASFFFIVGTIVVKGAPALTWDTISKVPDTAFFLGGGGGVLNAILGSLFIAVGSTALALLISIPVVVYINMFIRKRSWLGNLTRLGYDVLFGIPSIVYGAFGFTIMIYLGMRASLLGGVIAVTLLVIPIMVRTMDEIVRTVPNELFQAVFSLGATRLETAKIILRQCAPGIVTAVLLGLGRGIGDVASVMFTAGFSDEIANSIFAPTATLPFSIFLQLGSHLEDVKSRAYAAALILTILVLLISILTRFISKRFSKNKV